MNLYEEQPRAKCILKSFGISYETHFEKLMLKRTDCEIVAYDASVTGMKDRKVLSWENSHDWIAILKVDIEGSEYSTFAAIMDDFPEALPFGQLQIELHTNETLVLFGEFLDFLERPEARGVYPWRKPLLDRRVQFSEHSRGGARNLLIQNYE
ncbi:hypothetical protein BG000_010752 [Podila horticola]|nr:hypothetical protein BG000_010752 [Podila horticola]